jgi:5-(carboxyamino)imidazole ribonucleotide mutase
MPAAAKPVLGLIMGSASDWPTLEPGARVLCEFGVAFEHRVVSAHRTPKLLYDYATSARRRGLKCIIAAAGGAAHLPGMAAALTPLPVLGVPVRSKSLDGLDSLLSIAQMPAGIPVATFRIGAEGAVDAAFFAIRFLATSDAKLRARYTAYLRRKARKRA